MTVKRNVMTIATDNSVLLTPTGALPAGGDIGAVNKYNKNTTWIKRHPYFQVDYSRLCTLL